MKQFIALLVTLGFTATAFAEDYVKDGRPCMSGVCIGDEISQLAGVKWITATSMMSKPVKDMKLNDRQVKEVAAKFAPSAAPAVSAAAPYLAAGTFDGDGVSKLAKVTGFCEFMPLGLTGKFVSESGHPTRVILNVEPGPDGSSQALRVKFIVRNFPPEYTSEQMRELGKQLNERYKGVKKMGMADLNVPVWNLKEFDRELWLMAPVGNQIKKRDQLKKFPGCGRSLAID